MRPKRFSERGAGPGGETSRADWVLVRELPRSPGHPFYSKLNELLAEADFDQWVEKLCEPYYGKGRGRPGIHPGLYFSMLLAG